MHKRRRTASYGMASEGCLCCEYRTRGRPASSDLTIICRMNNYEHTGSSAGKHAAQRPDLERVQLNAAESPYPTAPRNVREEQRAQAQRQRAAAVAEQAAQSAATAQAAPGQQPTQAIPGQQPTEVIGGARRGKHGRARNAQQVRNGWDTQQTQAVYGQQPTQAIPGQQPTAAMPGAQATEAMPRGKHGKRSRNGKPRKKSFVTRKVEAWCSRVLGAVSGDGLAEQEAEYASGPHHARLRVEHGGRGPVGHGVPRAHHRGHAACRRRAGGHVLAGLRHGASAYVRGQLRRAQLPGIRP